MNLFYFALQCLYLGRIAIASTTHGPCITCHHTWDTRSQLSANFGPLLKKLQQSTSPIGRVQSATAYLLPSPKLNTKAS